MYIHEQQIKYWIDELLLYQQGWNMFYLIAKLYPYPSNSCWPWCPYHTDLSNIRSNMSIIFIYLKPKELQRIFPHLFVVFNLFYHMMCTHSFLSHTCQVMTCFYGVYTFLTCILLNFTPQVTVSNIFFFNCIHLHP